MRRWVWLIGLLGALAGCNTSSVSAFTKIEADGSFTRTVRYSSTSRPESSFQLPKIHPGVAFRSTTDDDGAVTTTSRRVSAGHPMPADIVGLDLSGKPYIESQVSVQKLANGDVSYEETIRWTGASLNLSSDQLRVLKPYWDKLLPERLRAKAAEKDTSEAILRPLMLAFFSPPSPLVYDAAVTPDLLDIDYESDLDRQLATPLKAIFPDITDQECLEFVHRLIQSGSTSVMNLISGAEGTSKSIQSAPKGLLFVVKPPGGVVDSNGVVTTDGHVYWRVIPESLIYGDAVLHLRSHAGGTR